MNNTFFHASHFFFFFFLSNSAKDLPHGVESAQAIVDKFVSNIFA